MPKQIQATVQNILTGWKGEDAAGQRSPQEVAEEIDTVMENYLASLPQKTAALRAGQLEQERRVA